MRRALAFALITATAFGASRARYGGVLTVAVPHLPERDPALADAPSDAALASVVAPAVCQLDGAGRVQGRLATDIAWIDPQHLRLGFIAGTDRRTAASTLVASWQRLLRAPTRSPYRALLFPLAREGADLFAGPTTGTLDLSLAFPWPDLDRALCHPALGARPQRPLEAIGPFALNSRGALEANLTFPGGRPFTDRLVISEASERSASRMLALGQAQLVLGATDASATAAPALFATYLAFAPAKAGAHFRELFESAIDRSDLTRFFARAPSAPMTQLLPAALMPQPQVPRPSLQTAPPGELSLFFDASLDDQRAVAERIQVRLHDRGLRIALKPVSRAELRSRWAAQDFELMLHAVLLPPSPPLALSIVLELAGRHDLLATELPPLGAIPDRAARDAKAIERALALRDGLSLLPLYAQGARIQAAPRVQNVTLDGYGVPQLDSFFLGE